MSIQTNFRASDMLGTKPVVKPVAKVAPKPVVAPKSVVKEVAPVIVETQSEVSPVVEEVVAEVSPVVEVVAPAAKKINKPVKG